VTNSVAVKDSANFAAGTFADFDNDGFLDLFVANLTGRSLLLQNDRNGGFLKITNELVATTAASSVGASWGDYDNDGFVDLFVSTWQGRNFLYHNVGNTNHWIALKLKGTQSNRSAIGARVELTATIFGREVKQIREITGGTGYCGQNSLVVHFGLGDATSISTLRIFWPSGIIQEISATPLDSYWEVVEPPRLSMDSSGAPVLKVWDGFLFSTETSTNLVNWFPRGGMNADPEPQRFFRMMMTNEFSQR
jgi:hypothetical protein